MKTTVQALKELYATLGGDLADVALIERIPEMIEALNSIAVAVPAPTAEDEGKVMTVGEDGELGFADALPPVTSADAGKVLAVDEQGAWNPAEASGGGSYVLKRLGQESFAASPHEIGWKIVNIETSFKVPDDFAFFEGVSFPGMGNNIFLFTMEQHYLNNGRYYVRGNICQYYNTEVTGISNGTIYFNYYAKA